MNKQARHNPVITALFLHCLFWKTVPLTLVVSKPKIPPHKLARSSCWLHWSHVLHCVAPLTITIIKTWIYSLFPSSGRDPARRSFLEYINYTAISSRLIPFQTPVKQFLILNSAPCIVADESTESARVKLNTCKSIFILNNSSVIPNFELMWKCLISVLTCWSATRARVSQSCPTNHKCQTAARGNIQ